MKKIPPIYAIPGGIALVLAGLLFFGLTDGVEHRVYDLFLGIHPSPTQNQEIVLVGVDDQAVSTVGTWPISRSITADAVLLLKEMGARYTVFDIEYVNKSPRGVNASFLEETFPAQLQEGFAKVAEDNDKLLQALRTKRIPLGEAPAFADQFRQATEGQQQELLASLKKIAIDNDQRLARAVQIFGNAVLTVNIQTEADSSIPEGFKKTAVDRFGLKVTSGLDLLHNYPEISPVIDPILSQAMGIGYTNVTPDLDGVRRRIDLVKRYGDVVFPQLGFTAFYDLAGRPPIEVRSDAFVLKGAKDADGQARDLVIPRAQDGSLLINWPHTPYVDSFRHVSFAYLYAHDSLYANLVQNLKVRATWGYLDSYDGNTPLVAQAEALDKVRESLLDGNAKPEAISEYRASRDAFLQETGVFLASKPDEALLAQLDQALADPQLTADQKKDYLTIQKDLPEWFSKTRGLYDSLMKIRTDDKKLGALTGTICFLGNTNTGSTDMGVTPFESKYPNLGTHASVINMLLERQFVVDTSPWWSWALGLAGALALTFLLKGRKPVVSLSVGGGVSVLAVGVFALVFVATGVYLPVLPLASILILSFLGTTFFQFLNTEREKGFLRSAFSQYLSNDVIQQLIANPERLKLGGDKKVLTAMFTDIKGFSTISELMPPEELVSLLNQYLTSMSDIILDLSGTIDKYEGDAIIAFFGAPVDLDDHARRACLAAVRMKRIEDELNERFLGEKLINAPLLTRIGINTGDMVVGNMGTERKKNYTIMGDKVNLAARLEGVNKQYGTWILITEETLRQTGDLLVTRKLDRIRVVGKNDVIQLYQVVEEKGHLPEGMAELLAAFHDAIELFNDQKWTEARVAFEGCLKLMPDDGPSLRYRKMAADYEKTPPPKTWDGVFNMSEK